MAFSDLRTQSKRWTLLRSLAHWLQIVGLQPPHLCEPNPYNKLYIGSGQDGRVGQHCAQLHPQPHHYYNELQSSHHWESPGDQVSRSPICKYLQKNPHQEWKWNSIRRPVRRKDQGKWVSLTEKHEPGCKDYYVGCSSILGSQPGKPGLKWGRWKIEGNLFTSRGIWCLNYKRKIV